MVMVCRIMRSIVSAAFDKTGLTKTEISAPNIGDTFSLFSIINNPTAVLTALEGMFDGVEAGITSRFSQIIFPLLDDKMAQAASFVDTLRKDLLGIADLNAAEGTAGRYSPGGLGNLLFQGGQSGKSTIDLIKEALFNELGSFLVVPDLNPDGSQKYDATGNKLFRPVARADDIELIATDKIQFNVKLAGNIFSEKVPLSFDLAAPGWGSKPKMRT